MTMCRVEYIVNGDLSDELLNAMETVRSGVDVFDIELANQLRFVEINFSEYIIIGHPFRKYPEGQQQPIFGAILTREGKDYLNHKINEACGDALYKDKKRHDG